MLLNIKKMMKRGYEVALKEWRHFNRHKGNPLDIFRKSEGSYNPRLQKKYSRLYEDYWIAASRTKRFHCFNDIRTQFIRNVFYVDEKLDRTTANERFCDVDVLVVGCSGGILTEVSSFLLGKIIVEPNGSVSVISPSPRTEDLSTSTVPRLLRCGVNNKTLGYCFIKSPSLAEINFRVTGIDPNPYFIAIAKHHQDGNKLLFGKKLDYVKATVEEFSKKNSEKFDAIVISNVLEFDIDYWHKPDFLRSCVNCCKPGGNILITTMTPSFKTFLWTIAFDSEAKWNAVNHKWYRGTSPEALRQLLESMNCQVMEKRGIKFLPVPLKFIPDEEIRVWYFMHARKKPSQQMLN